MNFCDVISLPNLFNAWQEFSRGKRKKVDVAAFELMLEDNLFALHEMVTQRIWKPEPYVSFFVRDPKLRRIHKASVGNRVFFQALYRKLYPVFDTSFIHDSYSSRGEKGTHAAVFRLEAFARKVTCNFSHRGYVLKCDIRKFFDSIHHDVLLRLIRRRIHDEDLLELIEKVVRSFETTPGKGLPLGNVTSQLFSNIYLNELDQFIKHGPKQKYYIRYCDDFVILGRDEGELQTLVLRIASFLESKLALVLHPQKIEIRKISQGVDFLGYVVLPHRIVLRMKTKHRMLRRVNEKNLSSYLGLLSHCSGKKIAEEVRKAVLRFQ
ncbi:MAG TPA: reverse transcriptase domain-containing protein [Candidatus Paceibacterota bacterium]